MADDSKIFIDGDFNDHYQVNKPKGKKSIYTKLPCPTHKMDNENMGYIQWHEHADKLIAEGQEQTKCPICGRYLFPHEV